MIIHIPCKKKIVQYLGVILVGLWCSTLALLSGHATPEAHTWRSPRSGLFSAGRFSAGATLAVLRAWASRASTSASEIAPEEAPARTTTALRCAALNAVTLFAIGDWGPAGTASTIVTTAVAAATASRPVAAGRGVTVSDLCVAVALALRRFVT